jgi:RecJ-like exonuclease
LATGCADSGSRNRAFKVEGTGVPLVDGILHRRSVSIGFGPGATMQKPGKQKPKCRNCEGKGLVKQGDKKVKCQRCGGTGFKS